MCCEVTQFTTFHTNIKWDCLANIEISMHTKLMKIEEKNVSVNPQVGGEQQIHFAKISDSFKLVPPNGVP